MSENRSLPDRWLKAEIVGKISAGLLIPIVILIAGTWFTRQQEDVADARMNSDRVAQLLTHLASENPQERILAVQALSYHQATHDIVIRAAKELKLNNIEYFVYFIASYGKFQEDSKKNQFEYTFTEKKSRILNDWMDIYQSQASLKWTWKMYKWFVKNVKEITYATYTYDEIGQYNNF